MNKGRIARWSKAAATALALAMCFTGPSSSQTGFNNLEAAKNGWSMEQNRSAAWQLAQHRKLSAAIAALQPQRPGVIDAYLVSVGLDSDPVFGREANEAHKVLARRYGAVGRSLLLSAGSGSEATGTPQGSPANLATVLAAVAARMNLKEDVLILFATTHGGPDVGLVYRDGSSGFGMIAPKRMASLFDDLGIERKMVILSACYSGIFVPALGTESSVVITAASAGRTSFGCAPGNDWTFFGDAMLNNALRKPQPLTKAQEEAVALITLWEAARGLTPSQPQYFVGGKTKVWLDPLEARIPKTETPKVGRPANQTS